jgi:hypothetical protein
MSSNLSTALSPSAEYVHASCGVQQLDLGGLISLEFHASTEAAAPAVLVAGQSVILSWLHPAAAPPAAPADARNYLPVKECCVNSLT